MASTDKHAYLRSRIAELRPTDDPDSGARSRRDEFSEEQLRRAELNALVDVFLGEDYDQEKVAQITALQDQIHEERERLAERLQTGQISPEEYRVEFDARIDRIAQGCENILGRKDFEALFGIRPGEATAIIDPEIFMGERRG